MLKYIIFLFFPIISRAQNASISITVNNAGVSVITFTKGDYTRAARLFGKEKEMELMLKSGTGTWQTNLQSPIWLTAEFEDTLTQNSYSYIFYLSPGDKLQLQFDPRNEDDNWALQGRGWEQNDPVLQNLLNKELDLQAYKKDSLPDAVFHAITERTVVKQRILGSYFATHKTTAPFWKTLSDYVRYYPVWTYLRFKGEQRFSARATYTRNEAAWQALEDSLLRVHPLNAESLLQIDEYAFFLSIYLVRIKERIWQHQELLQTYYGTKTPEEARKLYEDDPENLLKENIIQRHFKGKTAAYLYGVLFRDAMKEKEDNLPEIFTRFRKQYPGSAYIPHIQPSIAAIEVRRKNQLSNQMIFIDHPESYQSFDDILKLVKGKTVLLDMWGTWCGPCRAELALHSEALHQQFKGQPLTFLYIANYDAGQEAKWKELIAYYQLSGQHLIASKQLTTDIMNRVKGEGFPTNVIIKKDGTFELSKAGYPLNRELLIEQLKQAMKD